MAQSEKQAAVEQRRKRAQRSAPNEKKAQKSASKKQKQTAPALTTEEIERELEEPQLLSISISQSTVGLEGISNMDDFANMLVSKHRGTHEASAASRKR